MKVRRYRTALVAVGAAISFTFLLPPLRGLVAAASSSATVVDDEDERPAGQRAGLANSGWWAAQLAFAGSSALGLGFLLTLVGTDRSRRRNGQGPEGLAAGRAPNPDSPRGATSTAAKAPHEGGGRADPFALLDQRRGAVPPPPPRAGLRPGVPTPPRLSFGAFLGFLEELAERQAIPPRLDHPMLEGGGRSAADISELVQALRFFGLVDDERRPTADLRRVVADLSPAAVRSLLEHAYAGVMPAPPGRRPTDRPSTGTARLA